MERFVGVLGRRGLMLLVLALVAMLAGACGSSDNDKGGGNNSGENSRDTGGSGTDDAGGTDDEEDGSGEGLRGTFDFGVSGALEGTLRAGKTGGGYFQLDKESNYCALAFSAQDVEGEQSNMMVYVTGSECPGVGTYPVTENSEAAADGDTWVMLSTDRSGTAAVYFSESGTLEIVERTDKKIVGTLTGTLLGVIDPAPVEILGNFEVFSAE